MRFRSGQRPWGQGVSSRMIGANLHYLQPLVPLDHTTPALHPQLYLFQKTIVSYATKTQKKNLVDQNNRADNRRHNSRYIMMRFISAV